MNALPTTLQRMSQSRLFALFALAFFFLMSVSLIILFSSLSVTPSLEQLESLIRGTKNMQTASNSQQTVLGDSTPKTYSNVDQKTALAIQKAQKDAPAFVMKTEEIEAFMVFATGKLDINEKDSAQLIREINTQINHIDADYMRISIIDQKTLNQLVPSTNKNRLFFFLEATNLTKSTNIPALNPLTQTTPVQLGVIAFQ